MYFFVAEALNAGLSQSPNKFALSELNMRCLSVACVFFFESKSWNFDYILKSKVNNPCLMLLAHTAHSALKMEK